MDTWRNGLTGQSSCDMECLSGRVDEYMIYIYYIPSQSDGKACDLDIKF